MAESSRLGYGNIECSESSALESNTEFNAYVWWRGLAYVILFHESDTVINCTVV